MFTTKLFCVAGRHEGPEVELSAILNHPTMPPGWREVRCVRINGQWIYNASGSTTLYVCPNCTIKGEPKDN